MAIVDMHLDLFRIAVGEQGLKSREKIIAYNNLQQVSWLREALRVAGTVGRVVTPDGLGTGWLIGEDMILTNNHVISEQPNPDTHWIEFNYEKNWKGEVAAVDRYNLIRLLKTQDSPLDYSILQVDGRPGEKYGFNNIRDAKRPATDSSATSYPVIIQHPSGGFKQVALTDNYLKGVKSNFCWYTTDTEPGSSGSPVFDQLWRPFALHHAGGPQEMPDGSTQILNEGILLADIVEDASSVLGMKTEHVRIVMKDLLKSGCFKSSLPSLEWYMDNSQVHNAIKLDAKGDAELGPLIAVAAGVAVGIGAAHLAHVTSKETFVIPPDIKIELVEGLTQANVFDRVYDELLNSHKGALGYLARSDERYELAPLAAAFLAGVAAGAAAYKAGK